MAKAPSNAVRFREFRERAGLSHDEAAAEMGNDAQSAEYFKQAVSDEPANIIPGLVSSLGLMEISRLMLRDIFSKGLFSKVSPRL